MCQQASAPNEKIDQFATKFEAIRQNGNKHTKPEYLSRYPIMEGFEAYRLNDKLDVDSAILLIHGLSGTPLDFGSLAVRLMDLDMMISAVRLPGHATDSRDLLNYQYLDWIDAVLREIELLQRFGVTKFHLIGHSMGALLSLKIAHEYPEMIESVISLALPLKFSTPKQMTVKLLSKLNFSLKRDEIHLYNCAVKHLIFYDRLIENYNSVPYATIDELFKLTNSIESILPDINHPFLAIHNSGDTVVPAENSILAYELIGSENKEMYVFEKGGHAMMVDEGYEDVEIQIMAFYDKLASK